MADYKLQGKRAIVTGGSRGIGRVIARALAREGVDVVVAARQRETLEETARAIAAETGRRIVPVVADTTDREAVEALVAQTVRTLGGVDILVNAAAEPGGISPATRVGEILDEDALLDLDVKVVGYLRTARAVAPLLVEQGWGRIINIGGLSIHKTGRPVATLRNVGVAALTKNLADELGPRGVNVVAVHPGATRTERSTPESVERATRTSSIGRIIDAEEVAAVVTFLASPLSVAINGDAIGVGGGLPGVIHY